MIIEESRALPVPADTIVEFLEKLDAYYLDWHPDHISFDWLDGGRREHFYFAERIGGWMLRMAMRVTRSGDGRIAVCQPSSAIARLVFPWMSFEARSEGDSCRYIHRIKLRLGPAPPLVGKHLSRPAPPAYAGRSRVFGPAPNAAHRCAIATVTIRSLDDLPQKTRARAKHSLTGATAPQRNRCHASLSHA